MKGHPENPMSFDEVAGKFRACVALGRPGWADMERAIDLVRGLEKLDDSGAIARLD